MSHTITSRKVTAVLLAGLMSSAPITAYASGLAPQHGDEETIASVSPTGPAGQVTSSNQPTTVDESQVDISRSDRSATDANKNETVVTTGTGTATASPQKEAPTTKSPVLLRLPAKPQSDEDSSEPVATSLHLSDPDPAVSYAGDPVTITANLTSSNGEGIDGKQIKLTVYKPGVSSNTYYQLTDNDGTASFSVSDLDAGAYQAYAEFLGSQNWGESIYQASGESNTASLTVYPAEEKPAPTQPADNPTDAQTPTTVSITSYAKNDYYSFSSYTSYDFNIAAYDSDGKPVNDVNGSRNIELHVINADGDDDVETRTLDPEGKYNDVGKTKITKQLDPGNYEIYVSYIGRNNYASSQSQHLFLTISGSRILEHVAATAPSVEATGNIEYWIEHGEAADHYFSDEAGTTEIGLQQTVLAKLAPSITGGVGQSVTEGEKRALRFRSNAPFADFDHVEIDGERLADESYHVGEGSTLVTLLDDYVASLPAGQHSIGIVSDGGTATTTFEVLKKTEPATQPSDEGKAGEGGAGVEDPAVEEDEDTKTAGQKPAGQPEDAAVSKSQNNKVSTSQTKSGNRYRGVGSRSHKASIAPLPKTGDNGGLPFASILPLGTILLFFGTLLRRRRG